MKTLRVLFATALMCFATVAVAGQGPFGPSGSPGYGWGGYPGLATDEFDDEFDPADAAQTLEPTDEVTPRGPVIIDPGQGKKVRNGRQ